ncbi:MAG: hypothetical protein HC895_21765 [Leptolyngbyaceae cyanobacterium SM1_3_5]|nr:hypothetical protein [Leptolyngbyaceae cyanobacterium SM1_3_5]
MEWGDCFSFRAIASSIGGDRLDRLDWLEWGDRLHQLGAIGSIVAGLYPAGYT